MAGKEEFIEGTLDEDLEAIENCDPQDFKSMLKSSKVSREYFSEFVLEFPADELPRFITYLAKHEKVKPVFGEPLSSFNQLGVGEQKDVLGRLYDFVVNNYQL